MITQRYEQFWYKPIPHDFEKLILNPWSLTIENDYIFVSVRENAYGIVFPFVMG